MSARPAGRPSAETAGQGDAATRAAGPPRDAPPPAPLPAHGPRGLEGDLPAAHAHRVVTQLMLLLDGRPDAVQFDDLFARDASFTDAIGTCRGPAAIQRAWALRGAVLKTEHPHPPHGGASRGQGTALLSVQPQGDASCRVRVEKAYVLRAHAGPPAPSAFLLRSTLFFALDAAGRVRTLEDKWDEAGDWWCARSTVRHAVAVAAKAAAAAAVAAAQDGAPLPGQPPMSPATPGGAHWPGASPVVYDDTAPPGNGGANGGGGSGASGGSSAIPRWARQLAVARSRAGLPVDDVWKAAASPAFAHAASGDGGLFDADDDDGDGTSGGTAGAEPPSGAALLQGPAAAAHPLGGPRHAGALLGSALSPLARGVEGGRKQAEQAVAAADAAASAQAAREQTAREQPMQPQLQ